MNYLNIVGAAAAASIVSLLAATPAAAQNATSPTADYQLVGDYELGAPNFWDYLTYDPINQRIFISHIDRIEVVDAHTGKSVGQVKPFHDAHGVAIVADMGKGYADSGDDGVLKVFSLTDFHILKTIKVSDDADGVLYDPVSKTVLVVAGDSKNLTVVSAAEDRVIKTITLPGKPEFFAVDGHNHAFVNIADTGSLSRVDLQQGEVTATWKLDGCEKPHGLGYDARSNRLFSSCANAKMLVVDAGSGKNLASLPIGTNSDAVVVDAERRRAFSANGDGTLSVVAEQDGDKFAVQRVVPTFFGGRNMAIDPTTGTLYIAHGNMKLMSSTRNVTQLRFGWDGLNLAVFKPNN